MLADIIYVEAKQNYVLIHTVLKKIIVHLTFKSVEESLPANEFFRVHKSFLISVAHIKAIEGNTVYMHNKQIPAGRIDAASSEPGIVDQRRKEVIRSCF